MSHGLVHRVAIGQVADARVLIVTAVGSTEECSAFPVASQRRPGVVVDGDGDCFGEGRIGVCPDDGAHGGILHHQVELCDGSLHEPRHRRPPGACAFLVSLRHRVEHAREAA